MAWCVIVEKDVFECVAGPGARALAPVSHVVVGAGVRGSERVLVHGAGSGLLAALAYSLTLLTGSALASSAAGGRDGA